MKHEKLYKFLSILEDSIVAIILIGGFIVLVSFPPSNEYIIPFIILKFVAMILVVGVCKLEGYCD